MGLADRRAHASKCCFVCSVVYWKPNLVPVYIDTFNKSGRHLEFSMSDVISGKIMHVAKMVVCDTAVFWCRHAKLLPTKWGGTLRDDTKNGCLADYQNGYQR